MTIATVTNIGIRSLLCACAQRGADATRLRAQAGISSALVEAPDGRLTMAQTFALWEEAQRVTGDKALGLSAAQFAPFGAYRLMDYLIGSSSTVRQALDRMIHYFPLINGGTEFRTWTHGDRQYLEFHASIAGQGTLPRPYVEYIFACILLRFRFTAAANWRPSEVAFTHRAPLDTTANQRFFNAPVRFSQGANRMVLDRWQVELPQAQADPLLGEVLEFHAQRVLKRLASNDDLLADLRSALNDELRHGTSLRRVARRLAMSRRTLQRRLSQLGTSYRQALDRVRCELGKSLLREEHRAVDEVATRLGFSEPSAFYRAFRRWTGSTPQEYAWPGPDPALVADISL